MNIIENEAPKLVVDGLSIGVVVGTLADRLPAIAAAMSILWTAVRFGEWVFLTIRKWQRFSRKD